MFDATITDGGLSSSTSPVTGQTSSQKSLALSQGASDTVPGNTTSTVTVAIGGSQSGVINSLGDHDWYQVNLVAGQKYVFLLTASGGTALTDPFLRLYDGSGTLIDSNDDGGGGFNSRIVFTATTTGTYFIDAGGFDDSVTGSYTISAEIYTPPPTFTLDQIATQLTSTFWGGVQHRFVDADNKLTYSVAGLTPEAVILAEAALAAWRDVSGLTFEKVNSGAQITFDDNQDDAFSESVYSSSNDILSSTVNIGLNWLSAYGTSLDSYSFQTYIHEIGHALGLGHAGNYDGNATYGVDNYYANDSWAYSVMSYFDQAESGLGSSRFVMTAQMADIVAIQSLYGAGAGSRSGDTIYGHNATAGAMYAFASYATAPAFTIYDSGGTDTLDASGYSDTQTISLVAESFSSIGGYTNNISIARGTVIENANGGSGIDTIIGNSANNVIHGNNGNDILNGGDGNDTLYGDAGFDQLFGGNGNDTIYWDAADDLANVLGGADTDTLVVMNGAAPTSFNLTSHQFEAARVITTDTGSTQPWSQIVDDYNASWQLATRTINNDNATYNVTTYDVASGNPWDYYTYYYDTLNRLSGAYIHADNGGSQTYAYDVANAVFGSYTLTTRNGANQITNIYTLNDDGSNYGFAYDVTNSYAWATSGNIVDALGRLTQVQLVYDNGNRLYTFYDVTGGGIWSTYRNYVNADGVTRRAQEGTYDDGTRWATFKDVAGVETWEFKTNYYDAAGVITSTVYDAGWII